MENAYKVSIKPVKGQAVTQMLHAITFSQTPLMVAGNRKASIRSPALFLDTVCLCLGLGPGGLGYISRTATGQALFSQVSCRRAGDHVAKQASC